jgi:hypothetical protein
MAYMLGIVTHTALTNPEFFQGEGLMAKANAELKKDL